jgi:hypothetical protein
MKSAREKMDMIAAYADVGSYRGAAAICGVAPKTVRRAVERANGAARERVARPHNTDRVADLVAERVKKTKGRISAKRLLLEARAAGYAGSARQRLGRSLVRRCERRRARRDLRRPGGAPRG